MLVLLSVLCAVGPMLGLLGMVWWLDRYDREPLWILGLTFLWGALGATLLALVGNTTAQLGLQIALGAKHASSLGPVLVAPLIEEPTKALVLLLVLLSRHFDNTTDGFVYGAAVGLGFGMTENLLYFWQVAHLSSWDPAAGLRAWASTVAMRTAYSAILHATTTSIVGACLGFARFRRWPVRVVVVPLGFAIAVAIHGVWNGLLTIDASPDTQATLARTDLLVFPAEALVTFLVFQLALLSERRDIRVELEAEARAGTLPTAHVRRIASWLQRGRPGWIPVGVPREAYVRATTTLAFRRRQSRMRPDDPFYRGGSRALASRSPGPSGHGPRLKNPRRDLNPVAACPCEPATQVAVGTTSPRHAWPSVPGCPGRG